MNDEPKGLDPTAEPVDDSSESHEVPFVSSVKEEHEDAPQFGLDTASPAVSDEENPLGGDATDSEPVDIDAAIDQFGLKDGPQE